MHVLSPAANVYLVQHHDVVGSDGTTHKGPSLLNRLVVNSSGHTSWAYAFF